MKRFQPFRIQMNPGPKDAVRNGYAGTMVEIAEKLLQGEIVHIESKENTPIALAPLQKRLENDYENNGSDYSNQKYGLSERGGSRLRKIVSRR